MAKAGFSDFRFDPSGIEEVAKSGAMQSELLRHAQKIAHQANALASTHVDGLHITGFQVDPYAAHVDILDHTAVGAAHTNGKMGQIDQAQYATLDSVNH